MKTAVIWLGALRALGVLNFAIWQKEKALAEVPVLVERKHSVK